jgi:ribonuclease D
MSDSVDRPRQQQEDRPIRAGAAYSRGRHRARQHEYAHAEASNHPPEKVIDHPLVPRGQGELIVTQAALIEFVSHLRSSQRFAYDSEFIGELSYHPRLCLIQASTEQRIGLIDPMAPAIDLRPFWELLADESIEKIVHAGEQDIEPVHRLTGSRAQNIFDTQIAAGFVGLAYPVGLSKLISEILGVRIGKGLTFTHWDQRPLSGIQLKYAADDVRYLPAIRAEIGRRLQLLGHTKWSHQECDSLCDPGRYGFDPQTQFMRIRGAGSLSPQGLAILRELTIWRDAAARKHDLPARAFLKDEILLDMAHSPIKGIEKLARVKGLPRPVEAEYGEAIVEATARALALPADARPPAREAEPTPSERFGAESLYAAVAALCAGSSIDPALVASRQEVSDLYRALSSGAQMPELRILHGWRREACGQKLLDLFHGQTTVELAWREQRLHAR